MKIILKNEAIHTEREDRTLVDYYIFPEYEIHYNEIRPGVVQKWHHHSTIWETIFIIEGEIEIRWRDEKGEQKSQIVSKGDVIEVEKTSHTLANIGLETAKLVVFRFVPTGEDKREAIKNDKVLDE
jgi:uncharacterized cupin superfamily protein